MEFRGIYQDGVIRPTGPVNLPEGAEVEFQVTNRPVPADSPNGDFWRAPTLEELARKQGITGPTNFDDLQGGWPEDDDIEEFLRQVREGRR